MKIRYYTETDSLYIELLAQPGIDVTVVSDDIRIDIDNASKYYDVNNLEAVGITSVHMAMAAQPAPNL